MLMVFRNKVRRMVKKHLCRRRQNSYLTWDDFNRFTDLHGLATSTHHGFDRDEPQPVECEGQITSGSRRLESVTSGSASGQCSIRQGYNIVTPHRGNLWTTGNTKLNLNLKDTGLLTASREAGRFNNGKSLVASG